MPESQVLYKQWASALIEAREQFWLVELKKHHPDKKSAYRQLIQETRSSLFNFEVSDF